MISRLQELTGADVYVAMDVPNLHDLDDAVGELLKADRPFGIKIGLQIATAAGRSAIYNILPPGLPVFDDAKLKDIPNTVGKAVEALISYGPAIFNMHASGGEAMMRAAMKYKQDALGFAVTVLTSMSDTESTYSYGVPAAKAVVRFATMADAAGVDGVICSPQDLPMLSSFTKLMKLTPGVRPVWAVDKGDQKRVATPAEAILAGADGIVVGRPVLQPPSGISISEALRRVVDEVHIIRLFKEYGGLLKGHFILKSGRHSDQYLNKDVLFSHPEAMDEVSDMLCSMVPDGKLPGTVVGPETGGAKLARAVADKLAADFCPAKKTSQGGFELDHHIGDCDALLTEDIITTGGSIKDVRALVQQDGAFIVGILALINRGNVELNCLRTLASLDVPTWTPEECPLCKDGVPINTNVGHAKPKG